MEDKVERKNYLPSYTNVKSYVLLINGLTLVYVTQFMSLADRMKTDLLKRNQIGPKFLLTISVKRKIQN